MEECSLIGTATLFRLPSLLLRSSPVDEIPALDAMAKSAPQRLRVASSHEPDSPVLGMDSQNGRCSLFLVDIRKGWSLPQRR